MAAVHTGRWTDWSKGAVLGDQITFNATAGNVLVAFIAIFITLVGGFAWSVLSYILHQLLVTQNASDGLHHQILVMLRNRLSPDVFSWRMVQIAYAWRKRPLHRVLIRTISLAVLALLCYGSFVAAGIALSLVASTGEVLLVPAHCGAINYTMVEMASQQDSNNFALALAAWANQDYRAAYAYAGGCYQSDVAYNVTNQKLDGASASNCNFYVQSELAYNTSYPTTCPFVDSTLCTKSSSDSPNVIKFDTGFLDTRAHLGKNSKDDERLFFRRITTCSPLVSAGFSSNGFINASNMTDVAVYDYGFNAVQSPQTSSGNATFYYPYSSYVAGTDLYDILVTSTDILGNGQGPAFVPDSRLADNTTSVTLIFLANRALYTEPIYDPWFNATTRLPSNSTFAQFVPMWEEEPVYYNPNPGTVMGCINEVTICNPNGAGTEGCIEWSDFSELTVGAPVNETSVASLNLNENQQQLAQAVALLLYNSEYWNILETLGPSALTASEYSYGFGSLLSLPIDSSQWTTELKRLQATSMSILQRDAFTAVAGPSDPRLTRFYSGATNWDCGIQLFRSTEYMTFSVLGLGLIFGIGGLIVILGILITSVIPSIQNRVGSRRGLFRRQQWYTNDVLYLQKSLLEDREAGEWDDNALGNVPTTRSAAKFLPFTDVQPSMSRSSSKENPAISRDSLTSTSSPERMTEKPKSEEAGQYGLNHHTNIETSSTPFLDVTRRSSEHDDITTIPQRNSAFREHIANSFSSRERLDMY